MSLIVLCPTLGRPAAAQETWNSFVDTAEGDTRLLFVINDYERRDIYQGLPTLVVSGKKWMNEVLEEAVTRVLEDYAPDQIGFIGDDNRFRTRSWDVRIMQILTTLPGFAYCQDRTTNTLPTHVFASSKIIRALGYFGLPGLHHLYIDNVWRDLGEGAGCLYYVPEIVIDHLHPIYGRGEWDDSYLLTNSQQTYSHDWTVYSAWKETSAAADIQIVMDAIEQ